VVSTCWQGQEAAVAALGLVIPILNGLNGVQSVVPSERRQAMTGGF